MVELEALQNTSKNRAYLIFYSFYILFFFNESDERVIHILAIINLTWWIR